MTQPHPPMPATADGLRREAPPADAEMRQPDAEIGAALFDQHPQPVLLFDREGSLLRSNAAAQPLLRRGVPPEVTALVKRSIAPTGQRAVALRASLEVAGRAVFDAALTPLPGASGPLRVLCVLTERERRRDPVRPRGADHEGHFRSLADTAPVMLWACGADRLYDWFNRSWFAYTGRTLTQERGNGWLDGVHPEDLERCTGIFDASFDARSPFTMDYRLRRHDGQYRWISDNGVPRYAPDGSFLGFIGSCFDIHERKDLEERLAERTKALRLADKRKNEFLAMLSHELRNPLAPIANAAGILRLMERDNPSLAKVREIIDRQVEQMRRLVNDLVDVTRLTHGKIALQKEQVPIEQMVRAAVENAQQRLDAGGHTLHIDLPDSRLVIEGDSVRLAQALSNLISNAAKFTPTPGVIDLTVRAQRNLLRITVTDTGQGIRPDFLPHVFDLFAQQDQSLARSQGGLGVGLTIARRIAHLHGGEIEAFSDGPGRGAQFVMTLPLARGARATGGSDLASTPGAAPAEVPGGLRVLLIEDNADSRDVLRLLLEIGGNEVMSAGNAEEGLQIAESFAPQVVLCDIGLPGTDGFQLIEPLRRRLAGRPTLVAALTGHGREEDAARARAAGFDAFLVKPLRPQQLSDLLRAYAGKLH